MLTRRHSFPLAGQIWHLPIFRKLLILQVSAGRKRLYMGALLPFSAYVGVRVPLTQTYCAECLIGTRRLGWNEEESQLQASSNTKNAGITLRFIPAYAGLILSFHYYDYRHFSLSAYPIDNTANGCNWDWNAKPTRKEQ